MLALHGLSGVREPDELNSSSLMMERRGLGYKMAASNKRAAGCQSVKPYVLVVLVFAFFYAI